MNNKGLCITKFLAMKFLKDLYNETLGELIEDMKDIVEDIKSQLLHPISEMVDEFKGLGNSSRGDDYDDENLESYDNYDSRSSILPNSRVIKCAELTKGKRWNLIDMQHIKYSTYQHSYTYADIRL